MLRRLFTFLSAVSLVLCVATCVLWVRSYFVGGVAQYTFSDETTGKKAIAIATSSGQLAFGYVYGREAPYTPGLHWVPDKPWSLRPTPGWRTFAFDQSDYFTGGSRVAFVPHWLPAILFAALPMLWFTRWRKHRRRDRLGLCPACGYDLRATPGRCPECGAVPAATND